MECPLSDEFMQFVFQIDSNSVCLGLNKQVLIFLQKTW